MCIWLKRSSILWIAMMALLLALPALGQNELSLNPFGGSVYFRPGDIVTIDMDVSNLQQMVNGCQAFLRYDSSHLSPPHTIVPGGGPWEELIYQYFDDVRGDLDAAIGVRLEAGNTGTDADGTVAALTFTAGEEGITQLVFREDVLPDFGTMFSDLNAMPVFPLKHDSPPIYIDGTPPLVEIASVSQNGIELLSSMFNAVQGVIDITVSAHDAISGLKGHPSVMVRPAGGPSVPATFVLEDPEGEFHYTYQVTASTPNGIATVSAGLADNSDNIGIALQQSFRINKNQGTVTVELDRFNPRSSVVRNVVFAFSNASNVVIETRTVPMTFEAGARTATTLLRDVATSAAHISAKTSSHLRRRLDVVFDANGQFSTDFVGAARLLGGDLNGDNVIQMLDYAFLKSKWYTSNPIADVNGDGTVQMLDYSILQSNWFKRGDAP